MTLIMNQWRSKKSLLMILLISRTKNLPRCLFPTFVDHSYLWSISTLKFWIDTLVILCSDFYEGVKWIFFQVFCPSSGEFRPLTIDLEEGMLSRSLTPACPTIMKSRKTNSGTL